MFTDLIKEYFHILIKGSWLKVINKEVDRYNKFNQKARISNRTVQKLMRRYNELYPDDKIEAKEKE